MRETAVTGRDGFVSFADLPLGKVEVFLGGVNVDEDGAHADDAWIGVGQATELELDLDA